MRVGYGYKRRVADFDALDVTRVWIDGEGTERMERAAMLGGGLRFGDVLVLLARGDLGPGKKATEIAKLVQERGAVIEIHPDTIPRGRPGPKPKWVPSDDARFRRLWKDRTLDGSYVVRLACEDAGAPVTDENRALFRSRLNRRYGTRGAK